jgi:hypothetical protein
MITGKALVLFLKNAIMSFQSTVAIFKNTGINFQNIIVIFNASGNDFAIKYPAIFVAGYNSENVEKAGV